MVQPIGKDIKGGKGSVESWIIRLSVGDEMRGIKGNKHPELTKLTHWYSGKEEVRPEEW